MNANNPLVTADHPTNKASFREIAVSRTTGGGGILVLGTFGEIIAFCELMGKSGHAVPEHLRNNTGACMAVTLLAMRLEIDPFLLASKSYQTRVGATIAYEAQVFSAIVNTRAPIKRRPVFEYTGEGDRLRCVVSAEMNDGSVNVYKSPEIGKIPVRNSPLWKGDPEQQLGYYSIRAWARRYCPEICMGIYTPEEINNSPRIGADQARDVTPTASQRASKAPMGDRLDALADMTRAKPQRASDAEDEKTVDEEHERVTAPQEFGADAVAAADNADAPSTQADPEDPAHADLIEGLRAKASKGTASLRRALGGLAKDKEALLTDEDHEALGDIAEGADEKAGAD